MDRPYDYWTPPSTETPDGILEVVDGFDCSGCTDLCDCSTKTINTDGRTDCEFENEFGDGCITNAGEDVLYRVQNNVLQRVLFSGQTNESVQPLADNIKSLAFTYWGFTMGTGYYEITLQGTPPEVPDPTLIKKITVGLVSQTEELVDRSESPAKRKEFSLESDIFLRNLNE
jgi:hypothetical protein